LSLEKVNIEEKLALFDEQWKPKMVAELNGHHVELVKFLGDFVGHHQDEEDELVLVVKVVSGWSSGAGASGSRRGISSTFGAAPSIASWSRRRRRRRTCCSLSRPRRSIQATSGAR